MMRHATNPVDGIGIAFQVVGDGPPLLLAHGSALSHSIWRGFGYLKALRSKYRLILPDLRGHGRSDKPYDPASYAMDLVTGDVLAILDALHVERTHYFGYSFGARVGLSLAVRAPERLRTLTVGGGSARAQAGSFDRLFFPGCVDVLERSGMTAFLDAWSERRAWPVDPATRAAFNANDSRALVAYFRHSDSEPGIADAVLRRLDLPTLLFVGSNDKVRLADTQALAAVIPGARLVVLDGFDHATTVAASQEVLAVVEPFLREHFG